MLRKGQPVGELRPGFYGHALGRAVGLALIGNDAGVDAAFPGTGRWEIDIAGGRLAAHVHALAAHDPANASMSMTP